MRNWLFVLTLLGICSCSFFKRKSVVDKDVIARVKDEYLYASDVKGLTRGLSPADSVTLLKNYANNWVRKKLLLAKAAENFPSDDPAIARKVDDYRETLVLYEYEKALVNKRLDTAITQKELDDWYEKLKGDFPLENDVYLLFFIKLKKDAGDLQSVRKWIAKPADQESALKLEGYCKQFAATYVLDNGVWYDKETILKNFPLNESDLSALVYSKAFKEFKKDEGSWFVKVGDVLKKDEPSPQQFMHDDLVKAIIEKRRVQLIEKIYDKIYDDGVRSKSFEIMVH